MQKVLVFDNNERIGYGYVYLYSDGRASEPELFYESGEKLPQGWYNLVMTDEAKLVVMARGKQ